MTNAEKQADEIADLKREIDKLKAAQPTPYDAASAAAWANQVHQIREARATRAAAVGFSKADLAAMRAAAPDDVCRAIAMRDNRAPTGRPSMGPSNQEPASVRGTGGVPGGGTGWAREIPFGPSPHQRWVDRQLDAQDAKDRRELMQQKAKEALLKADEPK